MDFFTASYGRGSVWAFLGTGCVWVWALFGMGLFGMDDVRVSALFTLKWLGAVNSEAGVFLGLSARVVAIRRHRRRHPAVHLLYAARLVPRSAANSTE